MKRKLLLARHGQDHDNEKKIMNGRRNTSLTKIGVEQAEKLAEELAEKYNVKTILSSPMRRSRQSAAVCADKLGLEYRILPILIERNFGVTEGHPVSQIPELATSHARTLCGQGLYVIEAPGAESMKDFYIRTGQAQKEVEAEAAPEGDTAVICHAAMSQFIFLNHHKRPWEDVFKIPVMRNCEIIEIEI